MIKQISKILIIKKMILILILCATYQTMEAENSKSLYQIIEIQEFNDDYCLTDTSSPLACRFYALTGIPSHYYRNHYFVIQVKNQGCISCIVSPVNNSNYDIRNSRRLKQGKFYHLDLVELYPNSPIRKASYAESFALDLVPIHIQLPSKSNLKIYGALNLNGNLIQDSRSSPEELFSQYHCIDWIKTNDQSLGSFCAYVHKKPYRIFDPSQYDYPFTIDTIANCESLEESSITDDSCLYKIIKIIENQQYYDIYTRRGGSQYRIIQLKDSSEYRSTEEKIKVGQKYKLNLAVLFPRLHYPPCFSNGSEIKDIIIQSQNRYPSRFEVLYIAQNLNGVYISSTTKSFEETIAPIKCYIISTQIVSGVVYSPCYPLSTWTSVRLILQ